MSDLLEFAGGGDIENVVAAIVQIIARPAHRGQRGVARGHAGQGHRFLRFEGAGGRRACWIVVHFSFPSANSSSSFASYA